MSDWLLYSPAWIQSATLNSFGAWAVQHSTSIQVKNIYLRRNVENYVSHTCPPPSALLLTCNCFADLFVVHSPHSQAHSDYFTTQLEIDVLRSSSMGWKWPQSGLLIPVLHCFQVSNGVFVEFMINDIFFDLAVHFLAHHQSHLSLRPYSSTAFTNVQLLEKFTETFQLLAIVVKTMKMPQ